MRKFLILLRKLVLTLPLLIAGPLAHDLSQPGTPASPIDHTYPRSHSEQIFDPSVIGLTSLLYALMLLSGGFRGTRVWTSGSWPRIFLGWSGFCWLYACFHMDGVWLTQGAWSMMLAALAKFAAMTADGTRQVIVANTKKLLTKQFVLFPKRSVQDRPVKQTAKRARPNFYPIEIDWSRITSETQMWDDIVQLSGHPQWHGRNLDALHDGWVTGGLDEYGPPYAFVFRNFDKILPELRIRAQQVMRSAALSVAENGGTIQQVTDLSAKT